MTIDNATLLIGIAFSSASLLVALLIGWLNARNESYLVLGATGMGFVVAAVLIMGLRNGEYGPLQHLLPYTLILAGFSFVFAGTRRFRNATASLLPPMALGAATIAINAVAFVIGLTGIGLIIFNVLCALLLILCAVEHWRGNDQPRVALRANAMIYCLTAISFLCCAFVQFVEGQWVITAPPNSWAEDFNSIMCIVALTGIGALTLTLHHARAAHHHRTEANTDQLTGVLNRRALFDLFGNVAPAPRTAVLMLDLDHFKQINDRFGHAGGDQALQRFADIMRAELRPNDTISRIGGEEFCAVLLDIDQEQAKTIAEQIRAAFAALGFVLDDAGLAGTVSIGIAMTAPGEDFSALLNRADAALYQAKNGGRNQVRLAALRLVA